MPKSCKILFSEQAPTQYFTAFCPMAELLQKNRKKVLTEEIIYYILVLALRETGNVQHCGVWLSLARAPGLGPGGRRFESCHPDWKI